MCVPADEYWWNSFHSGLACASDGSDIIGPEKGCLSEKPSKPLVAAS
jgi:hypothetical protein